MALFQRTEDAGVGDAILLEPVSEVSIPNPTARIAQRNCHLDDAFFNHRRIPSWTTLN
jgi:hypothetical protein